MILTARKFLLFTITVAIVNAAILFYVYYSQSYTEILEPEISTAPSKYRLHKNKTWVWLSNLIVCENITEHVPNNHTPTVQENRESVYEFCPVIPPNLGPVANDTNIMNLGGIEEMNLKIGVGGVHTPDCVAQQRAALVVAVPDTNDFDWKVNGFIYYIHPFHKKQQLEYQIFIVRNNSPGGPFVRGKLFNIGFLEAQAYGNGGWDCFIFHDVDLVPLDTRNLYRCTARPKRLIADLRKPFRFGGAVAISPDHFSHVDGFSNRIWPNDDDDYIDMGSRLMAANFSIESNFISIGAYTTYDFLYNRTTNQTKTMTSSYHKQRNKSKTTNFDRKQEYYNKETRIASTPLQTAHPSKDGLSNIVYNCSEINFKQFYTLIEVKSKKYDGNE